MEVALGFLTVTGLYPLSRAWLANTTTTLRPALSWAIASLLAWTLAALNPSSTVRVYVALCLVGCAGVAVLGARRPGAGAWNFVVAGLLVVFLMPVASGLGALRLETAHLIFLTATLVVVLLNHLPTRPGAAVPLLAIPFGVELSRLAGVDFAAGVVFAGRLLLAVAPWVGWWATRRSAPLAEADRLWVSFRDRYGFLWAERIREQFNRSAEHAGIATRLTWFGLNPAPAATEDLTGTLRSLLKRFNKEVLPVRET
jgi:hypothetical protein